MSIELDAPPQVDGYLLLFRGPHWDEAGYSPEEMQRIMSRITAWFEKLEREGKWGGGKPLMDRAVLISGEGGRSATDGPFPEAKEAIGGYIILNVDSMEEAVEVARGNPMLDYGQTTEVRELSTGCAHMHRVRQKLAALAV